jgi:putative nucleotidyltransferase with HDIG domain
MNRELEKTIMTAGDLPTIPAVATKVMQLIESNNATAEELSKVVSADPAVAAKIIKISNSAFYGCQRKIQSLSTAIMMLGFKTLRSLVITASLKQVYHPYGLVEKILWEHSFGAGMAARIIAANTKFANEEESFLAGLFHDIGKIIMNHIDRDKFQIVMECCYNEGIPFTEAETKVYSFSHAEAGGCVIRKWNFPEALANVVTLHHTLRDSDDLHLSHLAAVVSLADMFCHKLGIGVRNPDDGLRPAASKAAELLGLGESRLNLLLEIFQEAYDKEKSFFLSE